MEISYFPVYAYNGPLMKGILINIQNVQSFFVIGVVKVCSPLIVYLTLMHPITLPIDLQCPSMSIRRGLPSGRPPYGAPLVCRLQEARLQVLVAILKKRDQTQEEVCKKRLERMWARLHEHKDTKFRKIRNEHMKGITPGTASAQMQLMDLLYRNTTCR